MRYILDTEKDKYKCTFKHKGTLYTAILTKNTESVIIYNDTGLSMLQVKDTPFSVHNLIHVIEKFIEIY